MGNVRTAVVAWLAARASGREFYLRIEDIDSGRSSSESARRQIADLRELGLDFDGEIIYQSARHDAYDAALAQLPTYECYCSRKEILEAARAPHSTPGSYPGTCRNLSEQERSAKRAALKSQSRVPALRLRADTKKWRIHDALIGNYTGPVDDFVVRRGGNTQQGRDFAYNLAVVVDDGFQHVDQVVRGDDLLSSAPRQAYLAHLLGLPQPSYLHVPLVLNDQGQRLAKRDGAVTFREVIAAHGLPKMYAWISQSLGLGPAQSLAEMLARFQVPHLSTKPSIWTGSSS